MNVAISSRLKVYQATAIFSVLFALVGFSYNVWRMEVSEENTNIRNASFEILLSLSQLEQVIYAAHFDQDPVAGNPRKGWILVGLVEDMSQLTRKPVQQRATELKSLWGKVWQTIATERASVDELVGAIDEVRAQIKRTLQSLE